MNERLKEMRERHEVMETETCRNGGYPTLKSQAHKDRGELLAMIDDCADYLKEGETPAECIARNRNDVQSVMKLLAKEKAKNEKGSAMKPEDIGLSTQDRFEWIKERHEASVDASLAPSGSPKWVLLLREAFNECRADRGELLAMIDERDAKLEKLRDAQPRKSSPLSTDKQVAFNNGWNSLFDGMKAILENDDAA